MSRHLCWFALLAIACLPCPRILAAEVEHDSPGAMEPSLAPEIYGQGVRETPWLTPADELASFHLPPGFEARLFASEPQIAKPLNMAFDQRGRLWVTQTIEYPYPAKEGTTPRDAVVILEDTDDDGSADKVTTFAEALNIPIGILPYGDGCICFSIPNLLYLRDTDGDGTCDRREVILGPFDTTRDTHGMINALRDGGDGWIYACHGFNNQSQVAGSDGHVVTMHSGNTFRFRPDGSRVEHVTHGQVNPFGMTEDEWGYRYSADCHSKPITQLVFGACYPSFGRPHDGLGFLPPMVEHLHGSTAICGIVYYPQFSPIAPLRGQMLSGNVMTSRINRNRVVYQGATAKGVELADFMTSDDPWFRPVDLRLGPDGHLYVADFYNKIIGHYEVPLNHPERDRTSGRIWQIRYQHPEPAGDAVSKPSGRANEATPSLTDPAVPVPVRIQTMQNQFVAGKLSPAILQQLTQDDADRLSVAAMRLAKEAIAGGQDHDHQLLEAARRGLRHANPHHVQASAELLGHHGTAADIRPLLERLATINDNDPVLRQTLRIAIRDLLQRAPASDAVWAIDDHPNLPSILLGLPRPEVSAPLLSYLSQHPDVAERDALLAHAARQSTPESLADCVRVAKAITADDSEKQLALINVLIDAQNAGPNRVAAPLAQWALDHVDQRLAEVQTGDKILGWSTQDGAGWPSEPRQLASGRSMQLVSSFGRGESYTGRRVSDPFAAPAEISFWLAGHNGFPDQPDHGKNRIQLVRVSDGQVLQQATPPRSDVAQQVRWDLKPWQGQWVRVECIDGDQANAYAWLALGGFQPSWLDESKRGESLMSALALVRRLGLEAKQADLEKLLTLDTLASSMRLQIAESLANLRQRKTAELALRSCQSTRAPIDLIEATITASLAEDTDDSPAGPMMEPLKSICQRLSLNEQVQFATEWAKAGADLEELLHLNEQGWLSPSVLVSADVAQAIEPRLNDKLRTRIASLTANLNVDEALATRLQELQSTIQLVGANTERGKALYTQHCANCHQLRGQGAVVGPQLDGAASRSLERLLEDIVTPDRNVDHAFRTTSFLLDDGRVVSGLITAESATEITVVEPTGKPIQVPVDTIEQRREAGRSLMPSNLAEVMTADDLRDLIQFVKGS